MMSSLAMKIIYQASSERALVIDDIYDNMVHNIIFCLTVGVAPAPTAGGLFGGAPGEMAHYFFSIKRLRISR